MKEFWDERYSAEEYIYGEMPSAFFKQVIDKLPPGKVLIPGAGEGRDAVYAASLGWNVHAFDQSREGRKKALRLAEKDGFEINYEVADAEEFDPQEQRYDLVALIFFHLNPTLRINFHRKLISWVKPGGLVLIEAFHHRQLGNSSGGPKDIELLQSAAQLENDFQDLGILENTELRVELSEGTHHHGEAEVVRFLARKIEL